MASSHTSTRNAGASDHSAVAAAGGDPDGSPSRGAVKRSAAPTQLHVLIVDDEADMLEEMSASLAEEGYHVLRASSGAAALQACANAQVAVIITDVRMPGMDGLELIERLGAQLPRHAVRPEIIVLTGHGTMDTVIRALRLHAVDFLRKPVTRAELVQTVRSAMDRNLVARGQDLDQAEFRKRYAEMQQTLARVNVTLTRLLAGEGCIDMPAMDGGGDLPAAGAPPSPSRSDRIRSMLRERTVRARMFRSSVLLDPSWDMLLELMLSHMDGRQTYLTSLCAASGLPVTTALRRIDQLVASGLVQRQDDAVDRRRVMVSLTEAGLERLSGYLEQVERDGAKLRRA